MAEINFELYNNQLVQQLVGPQDANLKLIEQLLNVTIGSFGNQITIQGNGEAVEQARTAIDMLYNKIKPRYRHHRTGSQSGCPHERRRR